MNQQKVVIITGASQGIGAGLVRGYRERGYRVVATARTLGPSGDEGVLTVAGDVRDRATAERVVGEAKRRFGRVDTLVNNAGVFLAKPFVDYTEADYEHVTGVNVDGVFHFTQAALREMLPQKSGHIVTITTSLVDVPRGGVPAGLALITKGGLNALTRGLAVELAKTGGRVNAVSPGTIKTPMHDPGTHEFLAKLQPVGRMGEVEDVTQAVLYLESAPFVTGEILHVDGGAAAGQD